MPPPPPRQDNFPALLLRRIEDFFFPPLCIVCDHPRAPSDRWLCPGCHDRLSAEIASRNACVRCGLDRSLRTCACEVVWDRPFERIISLVNYGDMVQALMQQVKYQGKKHLARYLGEFCASRLEELAPDGFDLAVPVPLHWLRLRKRGYNQAEWFARGLFGEKVTVAGHKNAVLCRVRGTKTQTKLDKSDRMGNVAGAFSIAAGGSAVVAGRRIALVDDVITTGATTAAAAQVLLSAGARSVTAVSFARD